MSSCSFDWGQYRLNLFGHQYRTAKSEKIYQPTRENHPTESTIAFAGGIPEILAGLATALNAGEILFLSILEHGTETGGLSGAPVREKSTTVIRALHQHLQGALPIIGVGGILSGADATEKINAGAALVQIYSGLIYRGPALIGECCSAITS